MERKDLMHEWILYAWDNVKRYQTINTLQAASLYGVFAGRLIHEMSKSKRRAIQVQGIISASLGPKEAALFASWYGNIVSPGTSSLDDTPSDHLMTMKRYRELSA